MNRKWSAHLHPRGRDGRFIEKGSIITWLLNGIKTSGTAESLDEDGKIGVLHDGREYSVDPKDVLSSWKPKATLRRPEIKDAVERWTGFGNPVIGPQDERVRNATPEDDDWFEARQTLESLDYQPGPTLYRGIGADPPEIGDSVHGLASWTTKQKLANEFALNEAWTYPDHVAQRGKAGLFVGAPASFDIEPYSPPAFGGSGEHLVLDYRVTDVRSGGGLGIDWVAHVEPVEPHEGDLDGTVAVVEDQVEDTTAHYPLDEFVAKYAGRKLTDADMDEDPRLTETGQYALDLLGAESRSEFIRDLHDQQVSGKPLSPRQSRAALNSLGKDIDRHVEGQRKLDQKLGLAPPDEPRQRSLKSENLGELQSRVDKLNKRAAKIGVEPMTLHVGERSMRTKYEPVIGGYTENGDPIISGSVPVGEEEWVDVTIEGDAPKLPGDWDFIGAVEHRGGDTNLIHGDDPRPAEFRTADADCAHCGLTRGRKNTVVLEDKDGNLVQVGKSCMKDFLGWNANPDAFLDLIEDIDALGEFDEDFTSTRPTSTTKGALITAAAVVRTHGFNAKSSQNTPTAVIVDRIIRPRKYTKSEELLQELVEAVEIKPEDDDTADAVITWAQGIPIDTDNNYLGNLRSILGEGNGYIDVYKDLGLVSSAISAMERDQERSADFRWFKDGSEWRVKGPTGAKAGDTITIKKSDGTGADAIVDEEVTPGVYAVHKPEAVDMGEFGKVGERSEFVGKVTMIRTFDNDFGLSYLVKMVTPDGHTLTTFSSGKFGQDAKEGDVVHAKGTVDEYTEFGGVTETKLKRVSAIEWGTTFANPEPKAKKKRAAAKPKKPKLGTAEKSLLLRLQNMYYLRDDENVVSLVPRQSTTGAKSESELIHNLEEYGYVNVIDDGAESGNIQATLSDIGVPTS